MRATCQMLITVVLLVTNVVFAQISSTAPTKFFEAVNLDLIPTFSLVDNTKDIRRELLDTNTLYFIVQANGLTKAELTTIELVPDTDWITIYQIGKSDKAFKILKKQLRGYVSGRQAGHSQAFLYAAIKDYLHPPAITDANLRLLATNQPWLAVSWLKKEDSSTQTNKAGEIASVTTSITFVNGKEQTVSTTNMPTMDEICRWVSYTVADGKIAWRYVLHFKPDGQFDRVDEARFDAKEIDPKYAQLIKAVDGEVEAEMKKSGQYGKFGSIGTFWTLKAARLKAKGIEWHSPGELNPNINYD